MIHVYSNCSLSEVYIGIHLGERGVHIPLSLIPFGGPYHIGVKTRGRAWALVSCRHATRDQPRGSCLGSHEAAAAPGGARHRDGNQRSHLARTGWRFWHDPDPSLFEYTWINSLAFEVWKGIGVGISFGLRNAEFENLEVKKF